jgi:hypothetical protein
MAQSVAGLIASKTGLDARPVYVGFVVDKVAVQQGFLRVLRFSPVIFILRVLLAHYSSINDALQSQQLTAALSNNGS